MSKIIRLDDKRKTLINYIKDILKMAENEEIEKIMIASFTKNNSNYLPDVLTGYYKLSIVEKQLLIAGIQSDINLDIVKINIDDIIEIINK